MRSLWMDPEEGNFEALLGDISVDVAVIGGGFSGLGAAAALAERGVSVALLEARTIASGASGRNAGFVLQGPAMPLHEAIETVGEEEAGAIWNLTVENCRQFASLVEEMGIECGYLRRGSMSLAASGDEWERIQRGHAVYLRHGIPTCLVPARDLPRPFDRLYHGGLYYAGKAEMNPGVFCWALAERLAMKVHVFERTSVQSMHWSGTWTLGTEGGSVRADRVVLATNAYTSALLPHMPIAPTRGQVLSTAPLPQVVVPFPMYANEGYQYWRQTADGRLVVGGWRDLDIPTEVGTDEIVHEGIGDALLAFARDVTGIEPAVEHRWAGIMGFTPDHFPLVGEVTDHEGLFMAAGYSGHGVSMAYTCGGLAARMAIGEIGGVPQSFAPSRYVCA